MSMLRVNACLIGTEGLTDIDRQRIRERVKYYTAKNVEQSDAFVRATQDVIAQLRTYREAVAAELAKAGAVVKEAPAPIAVEPVKETATPEAAPAAKPKGPPKRTSQWREMVNSELEVLETAKNTTKEGRQSYVRAIAFLLGALYEPTETPAAKAHIKETLDELPKDAMFREALRDFARAEGVLEIVSSRGKVSPVFDYIIATNTFESLKQVATYTSLPPGYESNAPTPTPETVGRAKSKPVKEMFSFDEQPTASSATETASPVNTEAYKLANFIKAINLSTSGRVVREQKKAVAELVRMWKAVQAEDNEDFVTENGQPLSAYFEGDKPKTEVINGQFRVVTEVLDADEKAALEAQIRKEKKMQRVLNAETGKEELVAVNDPSDYVSKSSLDDWNKAGVGEAQVNIKDEAGEFDGRYYRDDGRPLTSKVPPGRVRMVINSFLAKLAVKPKTYLYKNQADLKARNPALYARAAAERKAGDFDTASAVGYSFGNGEVIIFSDRVATERQLRFVLAHETLGHFGLRAVIPQNEFIAVMDMIYDTSDRVRAVVDTVVKSRGMPKHEAVEEYLADFAGTLDNNLLLRVWNKIKGWLNKLGFTFDDDMARYVLSQSRAYVRNGKVDGQLVDFRKIAEKYISIETMQDPLGTGRFFQTAGYYDEENHAAAEEWRSLPPRGYDMEALREKFKDKRINMHEVWLKVRANFQTMNYSARENFGFRKLYEILRSTVHKASMLRSKYNAMMSTVLSPSVGNWTNSGKWATQDQIAVASKMLQVTSRIKLRDLTDSDMRKVGPLFILEDGKAVRNPDVIAALKERGRISLEDFQQGFEYTEYRSRAMTADDRKELEAERDAKLKDVEDPDDRKDIEDEYAALLKADTRLVPVKTKFDPAKYGTDKLTKDSLEWKMYNEVRDTMDEAALDMLEANYAAVNGERASVLRVVRSFLNRSLTAEDREFIQMVENRYIKLRRDKEITTKEGFTRPNKESVTKANEFLEKFNFAVLSSNTEAHQKVAEYFDKAEYDDVVKGIETLRKGSSLPRDEVRKYSMQQAIQNLALFDASRTDAELLAKRSIAGGYVPFGREGSWQVRINAVDPETGRIYKVDEQYRQNLIYMQTNDKAESFRMAEFINKKFDDGNTKGVFRMRVLDADNTYRVKEVKLVAQAESARQTVTSSRETNLNEVIATLTRFSVTITPAERERLIVGLTSQNDRARTRLARGGAPGEDPNVIKYVSQHLESVASTVARKHHRHDLDRLFDPDDGDSLRLWRGSKERYDALKKRWEEAQNTPDMSEAERLARKREFDDYHYVYVTKDSQRTGNKYMDDGMRLVAFLDAQKDVEFTDFGSGETVSQMRMWTTFAQLGASPATAILNFLSVGMNAIPALAGYNEKNGFGGGFGWAAASSEMTRALNKVKDTNQSDVKYWDDLLSDPAKLADSGFSQEEAEFMREEVASGTMQAALTNAMLGSARGRMSSGAALRGSQAWMFLFNYSEQMARRATGLATFRLAYARELAALGANADAEAKAKAYIAAKNYAVEMIDNTLGQYAMFNRPAMFRGGLMQFVFMYKMFVVNTVQMLAALPRKEQLLALGLLMFFAGFKGLPFAEDIMDLIDTIAQMLGLGPRGIWKGSAEKSVAAMFDSIAPGMTPTMMRGVANHVLPANISDRVSLGNIVPGTGVGLAGADVGREIIEIGGPFVSFAQGAVGTAADTVRLLLNPSEASAISTLRQSPVTMARATGDIWAYTNSGAIVSQKGYIVNPDLHAGVFLARALGFYPSSAVRENDVVRMGKRLIDYRRDIAARYYSKYITASLAGDTPAVNAVLDDVADWNAVAKGTELELSNFRQSANRALREARRTTTERYMRTIPVNARAETARVMDMIMTEREQEAAATN